MQLDEVAVGDGMIGADLLAGEDLGAPHARKLQVPANVLMHQAGDIVHRAATTHREGLVRIG